jgi:hypothetical protein
MRLSTWNTSCTFSLTEKKIILLYVEILPDYLVGPFLSDILISWTETRVKPKDYFLAYRKLPDYLTGTFLVSLS